MPISGFEPSNPVSFERFFVQVQVLKASFYAYSDLEV